MQMSYDQYRVHCQNTRIPVFNKGKTSYTPMPYLSRSEWERNGSPSFEAYKADGGRVNLSKSVV